MKKAEQIIEEAKKDAISQKMMFAESFALGVLIAKYDMLRRDYLELKKEFEKLK